MRFEKEWAYLNPLPHHRFDIATVSQVRALSQFRVALDANRYSVPAEYAGCRLTLKTYPDGFVFTLHIVIRCLHQHVVMALD